MNLGYHLFINACNKCRIPWDEGKHMTTVLLLTQYTSKHFNDLPPWGYPLHSGCGDLSPVPVTQ